jgi:sterol desaturase/sphingolipid hydroxylase (fatty acid hydroxylase superfamily)
MLSAGRNHPLHVVLNFGLQMTILILLGAPSMILALKAVFTGVHGQLQHANIRMRMIPGASWLFSTPELHRWHHSRTIAESDHNYGNILIVWDVIFRSRFRPRHRSPSTDVGLPRGTRFPSSYWGQFMAPFRWKEVVAPAQAGKFV